MVVIVLMLMLVAVVMMVMVQFMAGVQIALRAYPLSQQHINRQFSHGCCDHLYATA